MSEYLIRKVGKKAEIAKFSDSTYPLDVYTVTERSCNCPSFRLCKHIKIFKTWKELEEPIGIVFDDDSNIIGKLSVA